MHVHLAVPSKRKKHADNVHMAILAGIPETSLGAKHITHMYVNLTGTAQRQQLVHHIYVSILASKLEAWPRPAPEPCMRIHFAVPS